MILDLGPVLNYYLGNMQGRSYIRLPGLVTIQIRVFLVVCRQGLFRPYLIFMAFTRKGRPVIARSATPMIQNISEGGCRNHLCIYLLIDFGSNPFFNPHTFFPSTMPGLCNTGVYVGDLCLKICNCL